MEGIHLFWVLFLLFCNFSIFDRSCFLCRQKWNMIYYNTWVFLQDSFLDKNFANRKEKKYEQKHKKKQWSVTSLKRLQAFIREDLLSARELITACWDTDWDRAALTCHVDRHFRCVIEEVLSLKSEATDFCLLIFINFFLVHHRVEMEDCVAFFLFRFGINVFFFFLS